MSLLVVKALGLVTVQDLGRPGRMHEALPPGGALVPSMLVRVNRAVRNADGAAAIEVCGQLVVRAERDLIVATDRARRADDIAASDMPAHMSGARHEVTIASDVEMREVRAGDEVSIASDPHRVAYLAVRGGIDAPVVLGGRAMQLSAGIGALIRAGDRIAIGADDRIAIGAGDRIAIDAGDRIAIGSESTSASTGDGPRILAINVGALDTRTVPDARAAIEVRIIPGPDIDAFESSALDSFLQTEWRISSSSNRVGTRLDGATIARRAEYVEQSRPMVIGAIEVPRDGAPIVLGPEHPTTGGYPILAVVSSSDLDALHSIPLGGTVQFRL